MGPGRGQTAKADASSTGLWRNLGNVLNMSSLAGETSPGSVGPACRSHETAIYKGQSAGPCEPRQMPAFPPSAAAFRPNDLKKPGVSAISV